MFASVKSTLFIILGPRPNILKATGYVNNNFRLFVFVLYEITTLRLLHEYAFVAT